jgi:class 3 adenylate cyclase
VGDGSDQVRRHRVGLFANNVQGFRSVPGGPATPARGGRVRRFAERCTFAFEVAPAAFWRAVSDTDAVNRDAGLPPVRFTYEPRADGLPAVVAHGRLGPLPIVWEEPPLMWEAPRRVAVERRFRGGPFARFFSEMRIEPDGDGARIEHAVELDARGSVGALLAPLVLARGRAGARRAYELAAQRARESVLEVPPASAARVARFVDAFESLRPHTEHEPEIAARLASFVEHAADGHVVRMRPYVLADAWGLPRERVLAAMLAATRGGLLDLWWTVVCPSCRGQSTRVLSLWHIGASASCDACGIVYDAEFDRNVEATFDVRPFERSADPRAYCFAGPHTARQTLAQCTVPANAMTMLDVVLPKGAYVVQALPDRAARITVEDDAGAATLDVRLDDRRVRAFSSAVRSGSVRVQIANLSSREAVVRVTEADLPGALATAAEVTALQTFRELFRGEVPREGVEFAMRSLTVLFSDIAGSTRMYAEDGDARAFHLVREHVDALREVVALHRGAIVKTIGDAVMAVFADPRDALEAALRFGRAAAPLELRVGLHRGPCIAMCANDRLDYFGATVNLASRIAHAAGPGEVLMTTAVADDARVAAVLPDGERGTVTLRGMLHPVEVVRVASAVAAR